MYMKEIYSIIKSFKKIYKEIQNFLQEKEFSQNCLWKYRFSEEFLRKIKNIFIFIKIKNFTTSYMKTNFKTIFYKKYRVF